MYAFSYHTSTKAVFGKGAESDRRFGPGGGDRINLPVFSMFQWNAYSHVCRPTPDNAGEI